MKTAIKVVWKAGENIGKELGLGKRYQSKKIEKMPDLSGSFASCEPGESAKKAEEKREWIPEFRSARNMTF